MLAVAAHHVCWLAAGAHVVLLAACSCSSRLAGWLQVLIMTVEPGFGGQSFMPQMMPKVRRQARGQRQQHAPACTALGGDTCWQRGCHSGGPRPEWPLRGGARLRAVGWRQWLRCAACSARPWDALARCLPAHLQPRQRGAPVPSWPAKPCWPRCRSASCGSASQTFTSRWAPAPPAPRMRLYTPPYLPRANARRAPRLPPCRAACQHWPV